MPASEGHPLAPRATFATIDPVANTRFQIRDTVTGEHGVDGWSDDSPAHFSDFIWTEGNFACDCNRGLFLDRALGRDESEWPCGDARFELDWVEVDGVRIIENGAPTEAAHDD